MSKFKLSKGQKVTGGKLFIILTLTFLCIISAGYWFAYTGAGDSVEAEPESGKNSAESIEADKYPSEAETTVDSEYSVTYNEGTPHEFTVEKLETSGENKPDLTSSSIKGELLVDDKILYTVNLENLGNSDATGMDILVELSAKLKEPKDIKLHSCGSQSSFEVGERTIEFSNVDVEKNSACQIIYKAETIEDGEVINTLYISPAAEGGDEIGPVESKPLTVSLNKKTDVSTEVNPENNTTGSE